MPLTRLQRGEPVGQCEEVPGPRWRKARSVNSQRDSRGGQRKETLRMEKAWRPIGEGRTLVTLKFPTRELRGTKCHPHPRP